MSKTDWTLVKTTIRVITLIRILIKFNYSYEIFTNLNRDKTTVASSVVSVENRLQLFECQVLNEVGDTLWHCYTTEVFATKYTGIFIEWNMSKFFQQLEIEEIIWKYKEVKC